MAKKKIKKKNLKRSNKNLIILLVIAVLFSVGVVQIAYFFYKVRDIQTIETRVEVGDKIGFALGKKGLDFGIVTREGSVIREIVLVNQDEQQVTARVFFKGDIAKFMDASTKNFVMSGNETKKVSFSVVIPQNVEYGNYTGKIVIIFERPRY
ncbi:MAG: hypothetical protein V1660_00320 [archaeon]